MKTLVLYYSLSGKTRKIAEQISRECGGDLIEVKPKKPYSIFTAILPGCSRAKKGVADPVIPETIDISGYDRVILATPVWAGSATPGIHGAINALTGTSGKKAFLVATCGGSPGAAFDQMKLALLSRGIEVAGEGALDRTGVADEKAIRSLIERIQALT